MGLESQMRGQSFPMSVNEYVIRPLLSNVSVIGLFFIPMITMRLFAEEKRTGTIELLATSPIRDIEVIIGKWLAAVILYAVMLLFTRRQFRVSVQVRQSGLEAAGDRLSGPAAASRRAAGGRHVHFHADQESDHRRRGHLRRLPDAVGDGMGGRIRNRDLGARCWLICR